MIPLLILIAGLTYSEVNPRSMEVNYCVSYGDRESIEVFEVIRVGPDLVQSDMSEFFAGIYAEEKNIAKTDKGYFFFCFSEAEGSSSFGQGPMGLGAVRTSIKTSTTPKYLFSITRSN